MFLALGESVGTARAFAAKNHYEIDSNQELIALGIANLNAGLFQGFTVDASLSATATGEEAGVRTQLSSIISAIMIILTIAVLAPLFADLPNAVLGAIIIYSVLGLLDIGSLKRFYREYRTDFALSVIALVGVIVTDVLSGLLIAVFLSVVMVVYSVSRPHVSELGEIPSHPGDYSSITRNAENQRVPGMLIVRLDAPLFFANANDARTQILKLVSTTDPPPKAVLFDMSTSNILDITSIDMLWSLVNDLEGVHVKVLLCHVLGPVRDKLRISGLMDHIGESHIYPSVGSGVQDFLTRSSTENTS